MRPLLITCHNTPNSARGHSASEKKSKGQAYREKDPIYFAAKRVWLFWKAKAKRNLRRK